ncbi:MAG: dockerin type I domain-containing protein [Armatimonadota bacterium]|nr:dockerin type I domain-containing protein [Armatimonadota bacterium]
MAFSPDGRYLISGGFDGTIRIWRVADGALLRIYDQGTGTGVRSVRFSPDGRYFAYGRSDGSVVLANNPFYTPPVSGDVNGDGCVNNADLLAVLFAFGQSGQNNPADVNRDGVVNNADLLVVLFNFGQGC